MTKHPSSFSGFFFAALAALIVLIGYFSGFPHWLIVSALTLFLGLWLGLLLKKQDAVGARIARSRSGKTV